MQDLKFGKVHTCHIDLIRFGMAFVDKEPPYGWKEVYHYEEQKSGLWKFYRWGKDGECLGTCRTLEECQTHMREHYISENS